MGSFVFSVAFKKVPIAIKMSDCGDQSFLFPEVFTYPNNSSLIERFKTLKQKFVNKFDLEPDVYIRVPGRVNLIGEHIDYCGYSVCPMAIDQDILLIGKIVETEPFLQIINNDPSYADCTVSDCNFV